MHADLNWLSNQGTARGSKHFQHVAPDQTPLVEFNEGLDAPLSVLIDVIYSQQRDGEICVEYDPRTSQLSFLTFIDISSLYNDKQLFAYQMAEQLLTLPPHPHLLNFKGSLTQIQERNTLLFKTECPEHISLWKQFCKTNFSTPRLLLIFRQITSAVAHMHDHGLVHRDVHPTRLHWCKGRPVFNLIGLPYNYLKLLKGKNFAGHLPFSAPELLSKQPSYDGSGGATQVTTAVDVWSLGCCLYYFVVKKDPFEGANQNKQHSRTKTNIMNMTIGDMQISDPLLDSLLNACLVFEARQRPSARQVMQIQDRLETQAFGYARSRCAMEVINGETPAQHYATYAQSDATFAELSRCQGSDYLSEQIDSYRMSGQQMGDEADQPKLQQRSNPWFFSKNFSGIFDVLEEAKTNRPVTQACQPTIKVKDSFNRMPANNSFQQQDTLSSDHYRQKMQAPPSLQPPQAQPELAQAVEPTQNMGVQRESSDETASDQFKLLQHARTQQPTMKKMFTFQGPLVEDDKVEKKQEGQTSNLNQSKAGSKAASQIGKTVFGHNQVPSSSYGGVSSSQGSARISSSSAIYAEQQKLFHPSSGVYGGQQQAHQGQYLQPPQSQLSQWKQGQAGNSCVEPISEDLRQFQRIWTAQGGSEFRARGQAALQTVGMPPPMAPTFENDRARWQKEPQYQHLSKLGQKLNEMNSPQEEHNQRLAMTGAQGVLNFDQQQQHPFLPGQQYGHSQFDGSSLPFAASGEQPAHIAAKLISKFDQVTLQQQDGSVYTGQVIRHGFGSEVDRYGNRYEGQWEQDQRSGQGKITFIDGSSYQGSWKQGKFHGQGALTFSENSMMRYAQRAVSQGLGGATPATDADGTNSAQKAESSDLKEESETLRAQNQSQRFQESRAQAYLLLHETLLVEHVQSYQGQFEQGIASGIATIAFSREDPEQKERYEGMIRAGKLNGIGKLTKRDGTVLEGIWRDNAVQQPSIDQSDQ